MGRTIETCVVSSCISKTGNCCQCWRTLGKASLGKKSQICPTWTVFCISFPQTQWFRFWRRLRDSTGWSRLGPYNIISCRSQLLDEQRQCSWLRSFWQGESTWDSSCVWLWSWSGWRCQLGGWTHCRQELAFIRVRPLSQEKVIDGECEATA